MVNNSAGYKRYLDPSVVSQLKSLELKARAVVEGFLTGMHRSPYHGFSVEFSEHRSYMQGDPIRKVDWKVYGKTDRFFIKQYEEETNLIAHVIIDVSRSMHYFSSNNISKLEYAKILAASLIYLMINQRDSVGLVLYADKLEKYLAPKSTQIYLKNLLSTLADQEAQNKTRTADALKTIAEKIKKRGLVILISDFFDHPDSVISAINRFYYKKNEVIVFQILDPSERNFSFTGDSVFIDMETGEQMSTQPDQIRQSYREAMRDFLESIKSSCMSKGIEYNLLDTSVGFEKALLSYLNKRRRLF